MKILPDHFGFFYQNSLKISVSFEVLLKYFWSILLVFHQGLLMVHIFAWYNKCYSIVGKIYERTKKIFVLCILYTFRRLHLLQLPYAHHYNPLLIRNRSWILTIYKTKVHSAWMNFKKWVKIYKPRVIMARVRYIRTRIFHYTIYNSFL